MPLKAGRFCPITTGFTGYNRSGSSREGAVQRPGLPVTARKIAMNVARLNAVTGESVEVHFSIDPYAVWTTIAGQRIWSTPGSGGAWAIAATDIRVSLDVPPNRPLPDRVLVKTHADHEFQSALEPTGGRSYSGQLTAGFSFGPDHMAKCTR